MRDCYPVRRAGADYGSLQTQVGAQPRLPRDLLVIEVTRLDKNAADAGKDLRLAPDAGTAFARWLPVGASRRDGGGDIPHGRQTVWQPPVALVELQRRQGQAEVAFHC